MSTIWDNNLKKLIAFKAEFGHTNVPKSYPDTKLARLVISLRQQKRKGALKPERELALHQIGFDFTPHETLWLKNYNSLVEFYRLNGHSFPNRQSDSQHERTLAEWVHRMQKLIRSRELDQEKCLKLSYINIDGLPSEHQLNDKGLGLRFAKMIQTLEQHIKRFGPDINENQTDQALYDWLSLQVQRINNALIQPSEYKALLNSGFKISNLNKHKSITEIRRIA